MKFSQQEMIAAMQNDDASYDGKFWACVKTTGTYCVPSGESMHSDPIVYKIIQSPVGEFVVGTTEKGCCLFEFHDRGGFDRIKARMFKRYGREMQERTNEVLNTIEHEANEYFAGTRRTFDFPIDQKGTPFEQAVWKELTSIPFGETRSYGEIAAKLGKPGASRAVGRANGANYVAIIVPCHRVIDSNGGLHGYGGGLWRKRWLLEHEGAIPKQMFD